MDEPGYSESRRQRFLDPVRVRRPAAVAGFVLACVSGLGLALLEGSIQSALLGAAWLAIVPAAALLGWGNAFFLEHGVGARRAWLELIAGALVALFGCALLGLDADGLGRRIVAVAIGTVSYLALFRALAAGIGLAVGRGAGYMGKQLQGLDDTDW